VFHKSRWSGPQNFVLLQAIVLAYLLQVFFPLTYKNVYHFTWTVQKGPFSRSLQNCGSSVWNFLHVTLPVLRILMWLLDFLENLKMFCVCVCVCVCACVTHVLNEMSRAWMKWFISSRSLT
jgi:hypothetical protein